MPFFSSYTGYYGYGKGISTLNDPYFNNTVLLLHMNGIEGSTNFIDSSKYSKFVDPYGAVQISEARYKFGGASGYFNNVNSYLTVNHDSTLDFSTGDWTIEMFCNINPVESDILLNKAEGLGFYGYQIRIINNRFSVKGYNATPLLGTVYELGEDIGPIVTPDTWYHVAAARQSNSFYLYVDGILIDSSTSSSPLYTSPSQLSIGGTNTGDALTSGYIDEVRLTKGICRYPNGTNFPVPQVEFLNK